MLEQDLKMKNSHTIYSYTPLFPLSFCNSVLLLDSLFETILLLKTHSELDRRLKGNYLILCYALFLKVLYLSNTRYAKRRMPAFPTNLKTMKPQASSIAIRAMTLSM